MNTFPQSKILNIIGGARKQTSMYSGPSSDEGQDRYNNVNSDLFDEYGDENYQHLDDDGDQTLKKRQVEGSSRRGIDEDGYYKQTKTFETLRVNCEVNGQSVVAVIDTGAQISIMSTRFAQQCGLYHSIDRRFAGRAVGVGSSEILGRSSCPVRLGALQFKGEFSVLENSRVDFIVGKHVLRCAGFNKKSFVI